VPLFSQQPLPHGNVTVLYIGQLEVDVATRRIGFGRSQLPVQEGGIGLVGEVVEPGVGSGIGHGCKIVIRIQDSGIRGRA
jgi:hypothetical protein